jgi:predicted flap endonuclease-1-like 5' DNA nuclease
MSLLYAVVFASRCRSNHHRLALDALRHLRSADAEAWRNLLLHEHQEYLKGAKAPDEVFKDFKNHVLHVREKDWGGAIDACQEWYRRTVRALAARDWKMAAWSAGVLSHYYVDPHQPFHTQQSEEENVIHAAVERSFFKAYRTFQSTIEHELGGYPDVTVPNGEDWLKQMLKAGAKAANAHYDLVIEHYDFDKGAKDPLGGIDQATIDAISPLVGLAAVGFARVLDRAFEEAAVRPPRVGGALQAFFLALEAPIQSVLKSMEDEQSRKLVAAQYEEFRRTGKVRATLCEDDRDVRALHAAEVLKAPLSSIDAKWPREIGGKHEGAAPRGKAPSAGNAMAKPIKPKRPLRSHVVDLEPEEAPALPAEIAAPKPKAAPKASRELPEGAPLAKREKKLPPCTLSGSAPVVDAPSIGPKTAKRLEAVGVRTVADLLRLEPEEGEEQIDARHISADVIRGWQAQAQLACTVPGLKSREAQALAACGVSDAQELAGLDASELCEAIAQWGISDEGQRAWGNAAAPTADDVATWIARAQRVTTAPERAA